MNAVPGRHLAQLSWTDLEKDDQPRLLIVPIGSTEQHGPHLPFTVDTDIAVALASAVSVGRREVVVAPPVTYGSSGEHQHFPGTLSIGGPALVLLLVELGRSATGDFDRVLFLNGHGGNVEPLHRAASILRSEGRDVRAWSSMFPGDAHAGETETSLMLYLSPDRVLTDRFEAGTTDSLAELMPQLRSTGLRSISRTGTLGDPTGATGERGKELFNAAATLLADVLDNWATASMHGEGQDSTWAR